MNTEQQNQNTISEKPKRTFWKFVIWFLVIIFVVVGGFFVWSQYFSPQAISSRETQKNYEKYLEWEENYEKAMREDIYGGKTPQETLDLFVEALRAENIELASKYFALNTNEKSEFYLKSRKWEEGLKKAKEERRLNEITDIVLRAKPDLQAAISEEYYVFAVRDEDGVVVADIDLYFNKQSSVWKIESL